MTMTFSTDKRFDLIAVGRACIDLNATEYNRPMEETMTFSKYVGGSPANIAIGSSKLGLKTGLLEKCLTINTVVLFNPIWKKSASTLHRW